MLLLTGAMKVGFEFELGNLVELVEFSGWMPRGFGAWKRLLNGGRLRFESDMEELDAWNGKNTDISAKSKQLFLLKIYR